MTEPQTPSTDRSRRVPLLILLVVALAGVVWFQFFRTAGTGSAASNRITPGGQTPVAPLPAPQALRLDALNGVGEFTEPGRNPFLYGTKPAPPAPPRSTAAAPAAPGMAMPAPGPQMPAAPVGPPPIGLKLTGITVVPETSRSMVTLRDPASSAVFQAFEGDIVDGRYRIVKVGTQSVVVSYVDGTGLRTIALGG